MSREWRFLNVPVNSSLGLPSSDCRWIYNILAIDGVITWVKQLCSYDGMRESGKQVRAKYTAVQFYSSSLDLLWIIKYLYGGYIYTM